MINFNKFKISLIFLIIIFCLNIIIRPVNSLKHECIYDKLANENRHLRERQLHFQKIENKFYQKLENNKKKNKIKQIEKELEELEENNDNTYSNNNNNNNININSFYNKNSRLLKSIYQDENSNSDSITDDNKNNKFKSLRKYKEELLQQQRLEQLEEEQAAEAEAQLQEINLTLNNSRPIKIYLYTDSLKAENDMGYSCLTPGQIINNGNYECKPSDVLTDENHDYLVNTILSKAMEILQSTLHVPLNQSSNLTITEGDVCTSSSAGPIRYNQSLSTTGVDADLLLFLTARPINGSILAFGFDCVFYPDMRTKVGQLNFNPSSISRLPSNYRFQLGVAIHETSHVLGFSKDRFEKKNLIERYQKTNLADNSVVMANRISSPNVKKYVQQFFNCYSLQGAELEDQGGTGTADSHWEKRIFDNEYMTGTASQNPIFSNLTLNLFADLGFYAVNYSYAETLIWGNGLGCNFATRPCVEWNDSRLFCSTQGSRPTCTYDRISKGQCSVSNKFPIPPSYYSYFQNSSLGGEVLPDYCPSIEGYSNMYCIDDANNNKSQDTNLFGEFYGDNSRCFDSSLVKDNPSTTFTYARCYPTACLGPNRLKVKVDQFYYNCTYNSMVLVEGYIGAITCPSSNELCINAPLDYSWPVFRSVSPSSAKPGDKITVYGYNFNINTTIYINGNQLPSISFFSDTQLIGTLDNDFDGDQSSRYLNVIVFDKSNSKSDVGISKLYINIPLDNKIRQWFKDHWYVVLIVGLALIGLLIYLIRCCCCLNRRNNRHRDQSIMRGI